MIPFQLRIRIKGEKSSERSPKPGKASDPLKAGASAFESPR